METNTVGKLLSQVIPDTDEKIRNQFTDIISNSIEYTVNPEFVAFNIMLLNRLHIENPGLRFQFSDDMPLIEKTIRFNISKSDFKQYGVVGDVMQFVEHNILNECIGTINEMIDIAGKEILTTNGLMTSIEEVNIEESENIIYIVKLNLAII